MAMRYNTLQLVNKVLNALDLQPVSTLGETEDAEQVLSILDRAFVDLELDINWFPKRTTLNLNTASGTNDTSANWLANYPDVPWAMKIPIGVEAVYRVYYNNRLVRPIDPREFLSRIENGNALKNTGDPLFWSMGVIDEDYVIFDNFDKDTETRLTADNSEVYVTQVTQVTLDTDTEDIPLSEKYFSALLHRTISYGFMEIVGDIQKGAWYNKQYEIAKNKVNINSRRFKPHSFSLGDYDFSKKTRRSSFIINDSQYNDISSQP